MLTRHRRLWEEVRPRDPPSAVCTSEPAVALLPWAAESTMLPSAPSLILAFPAVTCCSASPWPLHWHLESHLPFGVRPQLGTPLERPFRKRVLRPAGCPLSWYQAKSPNCHLHHHLCISLPPCFHLLCSAAFSRSCTPTTAYLCLVPNFHSHLSSSHLHPIPISPKLSCTILATPP